MNATNDELTDDDLVESLRQEMQTLIDRVAENHREGNPVETFFHEERVSGRHTNEMVMVFATDLREVGSFLVDFPRDFDTTEINYARKHWVYERLSDKMPLVLSFASRRQLQRQGFARVGALMPQPKN